MFLKDELLKSVPISLQSSKITRTKVEDSKTTFDKSQLINLTSTKVVFAIFKLLIVNLLKIHSLNSKKRYFKVFTISLLKIPLIFWSVISNFFSSSSPIIG
jgi:hypothetical protein